MLSPRLALAVSLLATPALIPALVHAQVRPAPTPDAAPAPEAAPAEPTPEPAPTPAPAKPKAARPKAPARAPEPAPDREDGEEDDDGAALWHQLKEAEERVGDDAPADEPMADVPDHRGGAPTSWLLRSGLTVELSVGAGLTRVQPSDGDGVTFFGGSGVNGSVGVFVSPDLTLGLRVATTTHEADRAEEGKLREVSAFAGPTLQYWVDERVFIGGGVGLGALVVGDQIPDEGLGFAFDLRVGYNAHLTPRHAFSVAIEAIPAIYDKALFGGLALQVGWQML